MRKMLSRLNREVSGLVRELREERGISQEQLAELSDLDRTYISGIERCIRNITLGTLAKIIPHVAKSEQDFIKRLGERYGRSSLSR